MCVEYGLLGCVTVKSSRSSMMFLRNFSKLQLDYTALHLRRHQVSFMQKACRCTNLIQVMTRGSISCGSRGTWTTAEVWRILCWATLHTCTTIPTLRATAFSNMQAWLANSCLIKWHFNCRICSSDMMGRLSWTSGRQGFGRRYTYTSAFAWIDWSRK